MKRTLISILAALFATSAGVAQDNPAGDTPPYFGVVEIGAPDAEAARNDDLLIVWISPPGTADSAREILIAF